MLGRTSCLALFVFGILAAAACGGSSAAPIGRCVPGQQDACACPGGATGTQICRDDGTFDACACGAETPTGSSSSTSSTSSSSSSSGSSTSSSSSSSSSSGSSSGTLPSKDAGADGALPAADGDLADCLTGGNVLVLNGDPGDYIHPGYTKITVASWSAQADTTKHESVSLHLEPSGQNFGLWWDVDFSTEQMSKPLEPTTYTGAERAPFATYLKPGLEVSGDGRGCNTLSGSFTIHDIKWGASSVTHLAATFEQYCEQGTPALRGCVVYDAPDGGS